MATGEDDVILRIEGQDDVTPMLDSVAAGLNEVALSINKLIGPLVDTGFNVQKVVALTGVATETVQAFAAGVIASGESMGTATKMAADGFTLAGKAAADLGAAAPAVTALADATTTAGTTFTTLTPKIVAVDAALSSLRRVFETLGASAGDAAAKLNAVTVAQAEVTRAAQLLTEAELELQAAMLTGVNTQLIAEDGVVTLRYGTDALSKALYGEDVAALKAAGGTKEMGASTESASTSMGGMVSGIAEVINKYFLLVMVAGLVFNAIKKVAEEGNAQVHTLNLIQGATSATDAQMQQWEAGIAKIDAQFGTLAKDSEAAFSSIVRAGFQGGDALKVLAADEQLAYNTGSTLADATSLLVVSLAAYGAKASSASDFTALLYAAWSRSGLALSDFNSIIENNASDAAAAGISFADLTSAVALFGKTAGSSNIATRDFQAMLAGIVTFSQRSSAEIAKLATGFDLLKFTAADVTGKFLTLAKASEGNVAAFQGMIGGAHDASTAFAAMDISTSQLATNAKNLGFAFDATKFNSLDAAGKLLYLATTVDFNESAFKKLTSTVVPTNAALNGLIGPVTQAGQHLADLGTHFDMAAFKSADLGGKLRMLAQVLGDGTPAFLAAIGGAKNLGEAHILMAQKVETSAQQIADAHTKIQKAQNKTADDAATAAGRFNSAWSHAVGQLGASFGPFESSFLNQLSYLLGSKVPSIIQSSEPPADKGMAHYLSSLNTAADNGYNMFGQHATQFYGTTAPSIIRNEAPANYQANLDYLHAGSRAFTDTGKITADYTNLYGHYLPSIIAQNKEQNYQANLDYLHQSSLAAIHSEPLLTAPINHLYGIMLPSEIRAQAPAAYQSTLDYFHQQSVAQDKAHTQVMQFLNKMYQQDIPASVRNAAPAGYQGDLDYFHRMSQAFDNEKTGVKKDVTNLFGLDIPSVIAQKKEAGYQASLDYFHRMQQAENQLPQMIIPPVSTVYGTQTPSAIRNAAPMGYAESLNYIEQQAKAQVTGGKKIVNQTATTYQSDIPGEIRKGEGPTVTAVDHTNTTITQHYRSSGIDWGNAIHNALNAIEGFFRDLGNRLVGSSIVPEMNAAITASFNSGGAQWLASVKTSIANILSSFISGGASWISAVGQDMAGVIGKILSFAGQAWSAGLTIVNNIANGIRAGIGNVVSAMFSIMSAIAAHMPHSPAQEGPLSKLDTFMPGMIDTLVAGIESNTARLRQASLKMAADISLPLSQNVSFTGVSQLGSTSTSTAHADTMQVVAVLLQIFQVLRTRPAGAATGGMSGGYRTGGSALSQGQLSALYQALNRYGGMTFESGGRGAFAGMGV